MKLNQKLMDWADIVFVMEHKHRDIIKQRFALQDKPLIVLNIKDNYRFNDPELVEILKNGIGRIEIS